MAHLDHDLDDEQLVCIDFTPGSLAVHPTSIDVSIGKRHRVHWFLCGEGTIDLIEFKSDSKTKKSFNKNLGPFRAPHNIAKSRRHILSETVENESYQDHTFPYTVKATDAKGTQHSVDPDVHVMPYPKPKKT